MTVRFGALPRADVVVARDLRELLAARGEGRVPLAGGTDLLVRAVHLRESLPALVWTQRVPELCGVEVSATGVRIGSAESLTRLGRDPELRRLVPALLDATEIVGSPQIRARATLAGNLCNASPAADTVPALLVHSGKVVVAGESGAWRTAEVTEFCLGPGRVALGAGEVVVAVLLDCCGPASASAYARFTYRRSMDLAFVGAAARIDLTPGGREIARADLALGAVGPTALRLPEVARQLEGKVLAAGDLAQAADAAAELAQPISDLRATADYRRHIVRTLVRDVLGTTWRRATEKAAA